MRYLRSLLARIAGLFTGRNADDELRAELQSHLEMETEENIRRGMSPGEARRQALLSSGGLAQAADAVRDRRGLPTVESMVADVRYALRSLRRSPAFTAVVVLTLGLGIGANSAIFSVVRAVLLKPLPHRDGDRLVYLRHSADGPGRGDINFSVPEVRDIREGVGSLSGVAEYSSYSVIHQVADEPQRVDVGLVTGNYFEVMGLAPILGRVTQPGDDGPTAPPVVVLTFDYWRNRMGGDSAIVGRTISLNRKPVTVIGVLQPAPFFPERVAMLLNMVISEHHMSASMVEGRTHRMTRVVARLRPEASLDGVRAEVATVYTNVQSRFVEAYDTAAHFKVTVIPFREAMGEEARLTLWLLMASAAFVLIVSAANVANLTLMRGVRRESELVVRAALGAGVARLRRLLLAENLVLAGLGAVLGLALAVFGVDLLARFAERYSARAGEIQLDRVVLAFTLAVSVAVALVLSFLAAVPGEGTMLPGPARIAGSRRRQRVQRLLVVLQVAVSVVLLAGAGLLTRTMKELASADTGLVTEDVLTMQVTLLDRAELQDAAAMSGAIQRYEQMRDEIAALPGVLEVGLGGTLPLRTPWFFNLVQAEGKPPAPGEALPRAEFRSANPQYFSAAGIPLVAGRTFAATDGRSSNAVIINQTLADRFFPGEDPIGKRLGWMMDWRPDTLKWQTIVGVVGATRDGGPEAAPTPVVFMPMTGVMIFGAGFVIRTDGSVTGLPVAASRIVRGIAPGALIENLMTISQFRELGVAPRRLNALLISLFGGLAVLIAAVGIAGVLGFSVSARTNEIGIRMSLGATGGRVQRMVLREGGVLLVAGLLLGAAGASLATRAIQGLLFNVTPDDPATLGGVGLLMGAVGLVACWIPALRAARIDPAISMRSVT